MSIVTAVDFAEVNIPLVIGVRGTSTWSSASSSISRMAFSSDVDIRFSWLLVNRFENRKVDAPLESSSTDATERMGERVMELELSLGLEVELRMEGAALSGVTGRGVSAYESIKALPLVSLGVVDRTLRLLPPVLAVCFRT